MNLIDHKCRKKHHQLDFSETGVLKDATNEQEVMHNDAEGTTNANKRVTHKGCSDVVEQVHWCCRQEGIRRSQESRPANKGRCKRLREARRSCRNGERDQERTRLLRTFALRLWPPGWGRSWQMLCTSSKSRDQGLDWIDKKRLGSDPKAS